MSVVQKLLIFKLCARLERTRPGSWRVRWRLWKNEKFVVFVLDTYNIKMCRPKTFISRFQYEFSHVTKLHNDKKERLEALCLMAGGRAEAEVMSEQPLFSDEKLSCFDNFLSPRFPSRNLA